MPSAMNITRTIQWPDEEILAFLRELRERTPLTHYISNQVAANITANVLLAVGASPAMVISSNEVEGFVKMAQGLLINIGTITSRDERAMLKAAASAHEAGTPWVLDPVAVGISEYRTRVSNDLIAFNPSIIRGNASEILSISGAFGGSKGTDSTASSTDAVDAARYIAAKTKSVVAVSGEVDYITDGESVVAVPGGNVIMTRVTAIGCALGALMAAFLPVTGDALKSAVAASAVYAAAGERAFKNSKGTGSFAAAFLDALYLLGTE